MLKVSFMVVKFESGFDALDKRLKKNKNWNDSSNAGLMAPGTGLRKHSSSNI